MAAARRLAAIMFTDIAGFTPLAQADEAGALRLLQEQEELVGPILETHRGRKVKSTGDGLLIEFPNALDAVECGVDLQRHVHERNAREGTRPLRVRVGIHLGDVQGIGTDIFGDAVNIASRVEPLADPGGVCLSEPVYVQVRNKVPYQLEKLGSKSLKGVREPVDVYRVALPWAAEEAPAQGPIPPRLAVLPLANISPDPNDEYFADGLTEELISVISQIRGLRVISRTSVNQYKATTKPVAQIGNELGVSSVLEGSVRKAGDQLRITVQLIDVRTDEHRWAQTYDRTLDNVFAIQADVAERTAAALQVELRKSEREAIQERPTSNLVAYESYLQGIQAWRRLSIGHPQEESDKALHCFEEAIREDPEFSAAYSYLANFLIGVMGSYRSAREVLPRARELVAKALELDPDSSDAHTACGNLAMQADLDWTRAEAEFKTAIGLNPSSSAAHFWYGFLLSPLQRFDEAKEQYHSAIELDPLWLLPKTNLVLAHCLSGDLGSAVTLSERLRESYRGSPSVRDLLAWVYVLAGRVDDAMKLVEPLRGASDFAARATRASVLALLGRPDELRALVEDWERGRVTDYVNLSSAAVAYARLGDKEKALALLERDCREGDKVFWVLYQAWDFDTFREDPRFVEMLRVMNLPRTLFRPLWAPGRHPST